MKILNKSIVLGVTLAGMLISCQPDDFSGGGGKEITFKKIGGLVNGTGDEGFAEISAFDPITNKLFIVNPNEQELSVWDLSEPSTPIHGTDISLSGIPNSVSVYDGKVVVALENAANKQANGTVAIFDTDTQNNINSYTAGALPDMVTFSPNGKYIVVANEGEPNDDYTIDPEGSITIINTETQESSTIGFQAFLTDQLQNGFRVFGPGATVAQDIEPEYIAISDDSQTAYVALQENNGLAIVDLITKTITDVIGLGVKDYSLAENHMDASDKDDIIGNYQSWPVFGFYHPDAITYTKIRGAEFIISANEGDARDYYGYSEEARVKDLTLDPTVFPNAAELQADENLGRLKTTLANGDLDGDGDYDEIYCYGGRSFSIWSTSGQLVYDSGNTISKKVLELDPSFFNANEEGEADKRSDDKGAEPEAVTTLKVKGEMLLFVGLERTGGVMVYNISNPVSPVFLDWLRDSEDISPEGLIAIKGEDSPIGKPLVIVTNEVSNSVAIYQVD
ncbi:choice-of-anchor I family protein [Aquimarina brevivitae]|uniref:Choice-of-anchor I domain-containing protein n=1 Tax=Aquimarina brevivitae TaxID=323412 RepID=A0A4Q7PH27_9FLAO|nr:choice-of-anchor I family protein [Aquimarina brevivitae]RZS99853.1 hypothetical protein EV197_1081 [Aquimarina brevivitae]